MERKPNLSGLTDFNASSGKYYKYGLKQRPFTYGILPDINNGDQAQYKYKAKIINLEEKCGGFAAVPGQDVIYQVNYIIAFLHDFSTNLFYLCFDGPEPLYLNSNRTGRNIAIVEVSLKRSQLLRALSKTSQFNFSRFLYIQ